MNFVPSFEDCQNLNFGKHYLEMEYVKKIMENSMFIVLIIP